jgi:hypothetical protein
MTTILFDRNNLPDDIFKVVFPTERQVIVAKLLIKSMQENGGQMGKTEMSMFATQLHDGTLIDNTAPPSPFRKENPKISYNKRQFYDRILTPMRSMGMIDYDLYKKIYIVSENFNKMMIRIGLLWLRQLKR